MSTLTNIAELVGIHIVIFLDSQSHLYDTLLARGGQQDIVEGKVIVKENDV